TLVDSFLRRSRRLPVSTLFPYTTLFRSSLAIAGNLPTGVTVSYANNGQVNAGEYTVTATIDGGRNYEDQALTAELTIKKATLTRSEEHTSELQSRENLVCRLLLEKKKKK